MMSKPLQERLRIKAGVMSMGEPIAFGSDTELMYEAADKLDRLEEAKEVIKDYRIEADRLRKALEEIKGDLYFMRNYKSEWLADVVRSLRLHADSSYLKIEQTLEKYKEVIGND